MTLRSIVALAMLAWQLGACAVSPEKQAAIDAMERRHTEMMTTAGGGGGGGM